MVEELFSLKWESHTDYMRQTLHQMMTNTSLTDVTLVSSDQAYFKAHKAILGAGSSIFHDIVNQTSKTNDPFIFLRGIDGFILKSILSFIYLGEVHIEHEKLDELLKASKDLAIRGLTQKDSEAISGNQGSINDMVENLDNEASVVKEELIDDLQQEDIMDSENEPEPQKLDVKEQEGIDEENYLIKKPTAISNEEDTDSLTVRDGSWCFYGSSHLRDSTTFSCPSCSKDYKNARVYEDHLKSAHQIIKTVPKPRIACRLQHQGQNIVQSIQWDQMGSHLLRVHKISKPSGLHFFRGFESHDNGDTCTVVWRRRGEEDPVPPSDLSRAKMNPIQNNVTLQQLFNNVGFRQERV